jgi:hypothetical protein
MKWNVLNEGKRTQTQTRDKIFALIQALQTSNIISHECYFLNWHLNGTTHGTNSCVGGGIDEQKNENSWNKKKVKKG